MGNKKYKVTDIGNFDFESETGVYNVDAKVDSFGFTTLQFGSSFSIRGNYAKIEQLKDMLQLALETIQLEHAINDGKKLGEQQSIDFKTDVDNVYLNDVVDW